MARRDEATNYRRQRFNDLILRLRLFGVSFAPLFGIFALRAVPNWTPTVVWFCLAALFFLDGYFIVSGSQQRNGRMVVATTVRDRSEAVSGYLATYLLPFIAAPSTDVLEVVALAAFFAVVAVVYVRSDLAMINPTLYLYGWRLAQITHEGRTILLLCRHLPRDGETVNVVRWLNVYIEKIPESQTHPEDA